MVDLYLLRDFFATGRKPNGGYFSADENIYNATHRNLSLLSDTELLALRDAALKFASIVETTHQERETE